jgi:ABC-type amino acid transport substrate-binding protein
MYKDPATREVTGIALDIYKAMASEMKVKLELIEDNWSTIIAGLQANKFDLTVPMAITPERSKVVSFTNPVAKEPTDVVMKKEDAASFKSMDDLDKSGKKVTTTMGSNTQFLVQKNFKNAEIVLVKSGPDSINQVLTNRADAWVAVHSSVVYALKEYPQLTAVRRIELPAEPIAFPTRPEDESLRSWINAFVSKQVSSGDLLRTFEKHGLDSSSMPS